MHKTNDAVPMKNDTEKGNEHKVLLTQINWDELFIMLTIETSISMVVNEVITGPTTSIS